MKKDIAMKWVEALRSGNYEQGREFLRDQFNKFCCLGVLCDIYPNKIWTRRGKDSPAYEIDTTVATVPTKIKFWSGLRDSMGSFPSNSAISDLAGLNDIERMSFSEIADFIEKNYEIL